AEQKLRIRPAASGSPSWRKVSPGQGILVAVGEAVEANQVLGSAVAVVTDDPLAFPRAPPQQHIPPPLPSPERTPPVTRPHLPPPRASRGRPQRFPGPNPARLRREPEYQTTAEELVADDEEDVYVRLEAASYLASVCDRPPRTLFGPYLDGPDPQTRLEAVIA